MKVGLDISQIAHQGGVGAYTVNLAKVLATHKELDLLYFYSSLRKPYTGSLPNVKEFKLPPTLLEILFNRIRLIPIESFIGDLDLFHSSDWTQPPSRARKVTTIHDLIPLKFPGWSHPKIVEVHKRRLQLVEKEVDMVIAVSQATKNDLVEVSNIPSEKITVIYEGVDQKFQIREIREVGEFREKYKLPEEFVLAIGGVGERRNLERVKEATKNYNLVITGQTAPWIPEEEMPLLYNAAQFLLYPSLYEGFGLPILEAMACGIPVITSNVSSMPEVGGEAVKYVDPEDLDEIKKAVREIWESREIREQMKKEGLNQAKKFSWKRCVDETIEVYRKVLDK